VCVGLGLCQVLLERGIQKPEGLPEIVRTTVHECPPAEQNVCFWMHYHTFEQVLEGQPCIQLQRTGQAPLSKVILPLRRELQLNLQLVRRGRTPHAMHGIPLWVRPLPSEERVTRQQLVHHLSFKHLPVPVLPAERDRPPCTRATAKSIADYNLPRARGNATSLSPVFIAWKN